MNTKLLLTIAAFVGAVTAATGPHGAPMCNGCTITGTGGDQSLWGWENNVACEIDTSRCGGNGGSNSAAKVLPNQNNNNYNNNNNNYGNTNAKVLPSQSNNNYNNNNNNNRNNSAKVLPQNTNNGSNFGNTNAKVLPQNTNTNNNNVNGNNNSAKVLPQNTNNNGSNFGNTSAKVLPANANSNNNRNTSSNSNAKVLPANANTNNNRNTSSNSNAKVLPSNTNTNTNSNSNTNAKVLPGNSNTTNNRNTNAKVLPGNSNTTNNRNTNSNSNAKVLPGNTNTNTNTNTSSNIKVIGSKKTGKTTRYWDCCKPSCSWSGKASVSHPVNTCNRSGSIISDVDAKSGCDGGEAFMCTDQQPWAINDNLSYGFAAASIAGGSESTWCCACYRLTFTSTSIAGKQMIVQVTNTGGDLGENHFDLQMPGGGLGIFDGCSTQFNTNAASWGERYGGLQSEAGCANLPASLQAGCKWRFGWFENADNPSMEFEEVECPVELTKKTGCTRN